CTSAAVFRSPPPSRSRSGPPCSSSAPPGRLPAPPGSGARRLRRPCPRSPRWSSRRRRLPRHRRAKSGRSRPASAVLLDDLLEVGPHLGDRPALHPHGARAVLADDQVEPTRFGILRRMVLAEVRPAAFLALQGRAGDRFRDGEQTREIQGRVPPRVEVPVPCDPHPGRPLLELADGLLGASHLLLV